MRLAKKGITYLFIVSLALLNALSYQLFIFSNRFAPAETTAPPAETQPVTELGEGASNFGLTIIDKEGVTHLYRVHTNVGMVGEALIEVGLIDGEQGPYGMYIKSVLGQTLDYETDGMYWAFYVGGEYAMTGVDQTPVEHDGEYMLKAEAAE